jgi:hypothetical protein
MGPAMLAFPVGIGVAEHPDPGPAADGEYLAGSGCLAGRQQLPVKRVVVPGLLDKAGQQRLPLPGPVSDCLADLAAAQGYAAGCPGLWHVRRGSRGARDGAAPRSSRFIAHNRAVASTISQPR